jgi:putative RecB family exonuclease
MTIRPLSFTQISLYQSCPLCYKLQYIDGLKPKDKSYFSFGTTMHDAVEYFFRVNTPPPPSLAELLEYYEQNWLSQGYESPEEEARYKDYGRDILKRFWEIHSVDFRLPVALERSFYIDVEGIKLRGFIDRVDKLESGGLSIIDYKTNKELFTADYLADDLQLTIYQMAAEQTWQLPVERLTLYHLRSNTPCQCPPRGPAQIEQTRRLILEVADGISRGDFPATEGTYCPCDFPEHCPYYRHQYLTVAPQQPQQEVLPGIAAIDAVGRYAALQAQIKELQAQLEEARQAIIDYCQKEGLNRVFGSEYEVTYKLTERTGFSEEEVKTVLEPEGLWARVLGFDLALVKQLLSDETVPQDIRNKLEKLKRIVSTYPQLWIKKRSGEED